MKSNRNVLESYEIRVGSTIYVFNDIELEKNALGRWSLTYDMIQKMMIAVAAQILSKVDAELTPDELEHVAKAASLNMSEIADLVRVDKSTVSKWRKDGALIPFAASFTLKVKLSKIIFKDKRSNSSLDFWLKNNHLPTPRLAS